MSLHYSTHEVFSSQPHPCSSTNSLPSLLNHHPLSSQETPSILFQSQSHFTTGGLTPFSPSQLHSPWDSRPVFFQLNIWFHSPYITSILTIGWVCRLQLLLVLASAVIFRSESRGTHDHILSSQIRDSTNLEVQVYVFISPRNRWHNYSPRHWVLFSSPPATRRTAVEVFNPASTRDFYFSCLRSSL
jgi:hypothetical protein